jgi:hypothetical protein
MPAKKTQITEAERSKRLQEAAKRLKGDDTPEVLDRALKKLVPSDRQKGSARHG